MKHEKMFYDEVVEEAKKRKLERELYNILRPELGGMHLSEKASYQFDEALINDTKVFFIDEMVTDSLMNVLYDKDAYRSERNTPFPNIFFEFEKPLQIRLYGYELVTKGMHFTLNERSQPQFNDKDLLLLNLIPGESEEDELARIKNLDASPGEYKTLIAFIFGYEDISSIGLFNVIPHLGIMHFFYMPKGGTIPKMDLFNMRSGEYFSREAEVGKEAINFPLKDMNRIDYFSLQDEDSLNLLKTGNFLLNALDYMNAQNVVVRRKDRNPPKMDKINRKRLKKGKKPLPDLKPYYFVEVKKHYVEEDEADKGTWNLNYRVWVRGHNRHYKDGKCIWINPYVKGPPEAPWKENRYLALYKRFRHLLKNPRYK